MKEAFNIILVLITAVGAFALFVSTCFVLLVVIGRFRKEIKNYFKRIFS